jgi:hypothetical protein
VFLGIGARVCVRIGGGSRGEITREMGQRIIFKIQAQCFLYAFLATGLEAVQIIPAILVKGVLDQRGAHDEVDLALGQAGAQLVDHVLGHYITLRNIDAINAREAQWAGIAG